MWYDVMTAGDKLSMSCDGGTLAVGTPTLLTGYKSTVLAPYLALLVLIGGAGIAFASSAKKKRSD
jgi:hypothetical protein